MDGGRPFVVAARSGHGRPPIRIPRVHTFLWWSYMQNAAPAHSHRISLSRSRTRGTTSVAVRAQYMLNVRTAIDSLSRPSSADTDSAYFSPAGRTAGKLKQRMGACIPTLYSS